MNDLKRFINYLSSHGFDHLPSSIPDGEIVRFKGNSSHGNSAWLIFYPDHNGCACGYAGDHYKSSDGETVVPKICWISKYDDGHVLSDAEKKDRERIQKENSERIKSSVKEDQDKVAIECKEKWDTFSPADPKHPYLVKKKIQPHGIRQSTLWGRTVLVVPFSDDTGIRTLEYIFPEKIRVGKDYRDKTLEEGGQAQGTWFLIGEGEPKFIVEGFATGCSVAEATGESVACAYCAGNIKNVAKRFPSATIVADHDIPSKTGEREANEASRLYGNRVVLIPAVEKSMDANDYACTYGLDALKTLLKPKTMFQRGAQLLKQADPQRWLIRDWIPQGESLIQLYATAGTGKSFLCLDWLLSIATGQESWFGHKVREGRVCYLFGEGSRGLSKRIAYWVQSHGGSTMLSGKLDANFLYNVSRMPKIDDKSDVEHLEEQLEAEEFHPDLIALDTLQRGMSGDENSTKDGSDFVKACDRLKEKYKCGIILIHHKGWNKEHSRGSTTIPASVDFDFELESKGDGVLELSQIKNKDNEIEPPVYMKLMGGIIDGWYDEDLEHVKSAILVQVDKPENEKSDRQIHDEQLCLSAFREHGYLDAAERVCINRDNFLKYLTGKLTDRKGLPLDKARLQTEINPKQGKFVGRLTKTYKMMEVIWGNSQTPLGFMLCTGEMADSVKDYLTQQKVIDF